MKLSNIKDELANLTEVRFLLPDGTPVPPHFHVTEIGQITKKFIDCGGTMRSESVISFQLYTADDHDHRLGAQKLQKIIALSETKLGLEDHDIEVEYQGDTIGKYGLGFNGREFLLQPTFTDCLAKDGCGIPEKKKVSLSSLTVKDSPACAPGSGCC